jgi:putative membrane protein
MGRFLIHWFVTAIALGVATWILPGVYVEGGVPGRGLLALAVAALVLGFVNAVVRPILVILTLPITILTLGLFYLVVNGLAFGLAALVVPGFVVTSFWWAILGALVVGLVSWFIGLFVQADVKNDGAGVD